MNPPSAFRLRVGPVAHDVARHVHRERDNEPHGHEHKTPRRKVGSLARARSDAKPSMFVAHAALDKPVRAQCLTRNLDRVPLRAAVSAVAAVAAVSAVAAVRGRICLPLDPCSAPLRKYCRVCACFRRAYACFRRAYGPLAGVDAESREPARRCILHITFCADAMARRDNGSDAILGRNTRRDNGSGTNRLIMQAEKASRQASTQVLNPEGLL